MSRFRILVENTLFKLGYKNLLTEQENTIDSKIDLFKKSVDQGGKIVFEDSNWLVLVPETLESLIVFKNSADWNIINSDGKLYNHYIDTFGGKYFINLNLSTGRLYLFHFESELFLNATNKVVNIGNVIRDNSLKQFYANYIKNCDSNNKTMLFLLLDFNMSEDKKLKAVKEDGYLIRFIRNPSEKVQLAAIKEWTEAIRYINEPKEYIQLEAIKQDPNSIIYIKNPTEKVKELAKELMSKKTNSEYS